MILKLPPKKNGELVKKLREKLSVLGGVALVEIAGDAVEVMSYEACEALRWVQIGHDHLQQGMMALTRSVARPTTF